MSICGGFFGRRAARTAGATAVAAALALALAVPAWADSYTYTVRLHAGAQGSFSGEQVYEIKGLAAGERVSFNQGSVTLDDGSKYYVKGIREAGADNSEAVGEASFTVTEDADYVVAYGIAGDKVAYTVRYVDEAGNELAPEESFWGNVGDSPIIGYHYIEGYQPQAYNLIGELYADASENVYEFVYRAAAASAEGGASAPTASTTAPAAASAAAPAAAAPAPAAAVPQPMTTEPSPVEAIDDDAVPAQDAPAVIEDIRDEATPLAGGESAAVLPDDAQRWPVGALVVGALVVVVGAIVALVALARRNRAAERGEGA